MVFRPAWSPDGPKWFGPSLENSQEPANGSLLQDFWRNNPSKPSAKLLAKVRIFHIAGDMKTRAIGSQTVP
jgi:hypothetical protein